MTMSIICPPEGPLDIIVEYSYSSGAPRIVLYFTRVQLASRELTGATLFRFVAGRHIVGAVERFSRRW